MAVTTTPKWGWLPSYPWDDSQPAEPNTIRALLLRFLRLKLSVTQNVPLNHLEGVRKIEIAGANVPENGEITKAPKAAHAATHHTVKMIESFDIPKDQVARWAGITSAVFSLSQAATGIFWGRASDRYGRKPVIMVGLLCTMLASLLFGFSRSLPSAIAARAFSGSVNGNVGIIRTAVAELVPQKELQPRAFSIMPMVWIMGTIIGPALGGALANPAVRYPNLFGNAEFFRKYPFSLPNMVATIFFVVGLSTGVLFLKESLEIRKHSRDYGRVLGQLLLKSFKRKNKQNKWLRHEEYEQSASLLKISPEEDIVQPSPPGYREVFNRQSNINLLVYTLLALHSVTYDQLLPIFMHYPPQNHRASNPMVKLPLKFTGGFGINSDRIGFLFTIYGICGMFIQFLVFPPTVRRFGALNCLKAVTMTFPIAYVLTPFAALLPTQVAQQIGMVAIMLIKCWASIFAFPCSTILLTNSAPSLRLLGTLNGVSTSLSALGRAAGPAIGGWTFSAGVDRGYVILPWWTLAGFGILGAIPVWWLVEMEGFGSKQPRDSDHSEDEGEQDAFIRHDEEAH